MPVEEVALEYLRTNFWYDFISFLPLGYIAVLIDHKLSFFWVIKAIRIRQLNEYLKDRMLIPIINKFIENKQRKSLFSEKYRDDVIKDHIFIEQKIYMTNIVKVIRLVCQMLFIAFFVGQYWFIFCHTIHEFVNGSNEETDGIKSVEDVFDIRRLQTIIAHPSFIHEFYDFSGYHKMITNMYFALTTLSTIGLGDFTPISNIERIFGSFLLLFGVAAFSYIMGDLLTMIDKLNDIDKECSDE